MHSILGQFSKNRKITGNMKKKNPRNENGTNHKKYDKQKWHHLTSQCSILGILETKEGKHPFMLMLKEVN